MKISTLLAQLLIAAPLVAACDIYRDLCTCGNEGSCRAQCEYSFGRLYRGACYDRCRSAWGGSGYCLPSDVTVKEEDVVNDEPVEKEDPIVVKGLRA